MVKVFRVIKNIEAGDLVRVGLTGLLSGVELLQTNTDKDQLISVEEVIRPRPFWMC